MTEIIFNKTVFKFVPDFPKYAVSQSGEVLRVDKGKLLVPCYRGPEKAKYPCVTLGQSGILKNYKIHLLVAKLWLEPSKGVGEVQINHMDGDKNNPKASNLEWVTPSQNIRHAISSGLKQKSSELYNSKASEPQVHQVCQLLMDKLTVKDIASLVGVSKDIVRKIRAGDTYFHIRCLYNIENSYNNEFSISTIEWVCKRIVEGQSDQGIVNLSSNKNLTVIEVKRIRHKIRYKDISNSYF